MSLPTYILITPARNEGQYLQNTIDSLVAQTLRPRKWIIVNDGSTDQTQQIMQHYANLHDFIVPLHRSESVGRSFGSKARAFSFAYEQIKELEFDFIGNLDADVTFQPGYYERVLERMDSSPRLGIAGGVIWDRTGQTFKRTISSLINPPGAIMMFRRQCFEDVGGYGPVTVGGVDSIAVLTARMKGWETRAFDDLPVFHHKPVGSSAGSAFRRSFRSGLTEYHLGTQPLFAILKALRRVRERPYFLGSMARLVGYFRLWLTGVNRDASAELVAYVAKEQKARLKALLRANT